MKIELDDGILDHPKFVRAVQLAGSDAFYLWCGLRVYCSRQLTDGLVPDHMVFEVRGPKDKKKRKAALDALLTSGLLEKREGGVYLHDYLDWSSSRSQVLAWRAANAERKRKSRESSQCDKHVTAKKSRRDKSKTSEMSRCDSDSRHGGSHSGVPEPSLISDLCSSDLGSQILNNTGDLVLFPECKKEQDNETVVKKSRSKKEEMTPIEKPEGWAPTKEHVAFAEKNSIDVEVESVKFQGHFEGQKLKSWNGRFSTWLANAVGYAREREKFNGVSKKKPMTECPDKIEFTERQRGLCQRSSIDINLNWCRFRDNCRSRAITYADWSSAFSAELARVVEHYERTATIKNNGNPQRDAVAGSRTTEPKAQASLDLPATKSVPESRPGTSMALIKNIG